MIKKDFIRDDELRSRMLKLKRGEYGAFLDLAGVSKATGKTIRMRSDMLTDYTREKLTKAFVLLDKGEIEFMAVANTREDGCGPKRIVASRKTVEGKVVSGGKLVYVEQLMQDIGREKKHAYQNLSLPPLPARVR